MLQVISKRDFTLKEFVEMNVPDENHVARKELTRHERLVAMAKGWQRRLGRQWVADGKCREFLKAFNAAIDDVGEKPEKRLDQVEASDRLKSAEEFVRSVLSECRGQEPTAAEVSQAAKRVVKALPPYD